MILVIWVNVINTISMVLIKKFADIKYIREDEYEIGGYGIYDRVYRKGMASGR